MLNDLLKEYRIILASGSPRRQQFFKELGFEFEVRLKSVVEIYPPELQGKEIARYLSKLKAAPFQENLAANQIVVTSDTVVWHNNNSLAKAADAAEAYQMLKTLSGDWHEVITAVTFTTANGQNIIHHSTKVKFRLDLPGSMESTVCRVSMVGTVGTRAAPRVVWYLTMGTF